jgi:hypothetical protein
VGGLRAYNPGYLELLDHYGLKPRTIHVGCPQQNGDIEATNGGLKQALEQHLLLRGSRDFASLDDFEQFVAGVMMRRNERRQARLAEETAVMRPLTVAPLPSYQEVRVKVNRASLIRVQNNTYSVPTNLIGQQITVRVSEWQLEVHYRQHLIETMPRLVGRNRQQLNYRHLIDSLLRKPGGFRNYCYRAALFPAPVFQQAWERLNEWHAPRKADLIYLRILRLAARYLESEVAATLSVLLDSPDRWDETDVERLFQPQPLAVPELAQPTINLARYDTLLREVVR